MRKVKKYTKKIDVLERRIETLERKIDFEKKRCELGKISKAEFNKRRAKLHDQEKILRGRITRFKRLRVFSEKEFHEKKEKKETMREEKKKKKTEKK